MVAVEKVRSRISQRAVQTIAVIAWQHSTKHTPATYFLQNDPFHRQLAKQLHSPLFRFDRESRVARHSAWRSVQTT